MLTLDKIYQASYALKTVIRRTDLIPAPNINKTCSIFLKPENLQVTGSFKVTLTYDATGQRTVVTFSDTGLDPYDLVTADEDGTIRVRNVKSLTELPLTGAAGGMVIAGLAAVLLALAGVSLAIVRRMERRM